MRNLRVTAIALFLSGWVTACAGTGGMMGKEDMMAREEPMVKGAMTAKQGMMNEGMDMKKEMAAMLMGSKGHHADGKVLFGMGMNDGHVLTLSDIRVDKVPDGYVYLARDGDWRRGVELGMLKQFTGTVSFDLPEGVSPDDYDTVVIWCRKFNVEIGRANYGKKTM